MDPDSRYREDLAMDVSPVDTSPLDEMFRERDTEGKGVDSRSDVGVDVHCNGRVRVDAPDDEDDDEDGDEGGQEDDDEDMHADAREVAVQEAEKEHDGYIPGPLRLPPQICRTHTFKEHDIMNGRSFSPDVPKENIDPASQIPKNDADVDTDVDACSEGHESEAK